MVKKNDAMTGKTGNGFAFSVPKNNFDNMELVDEIAEMQDGNSFQISRVITMLLGKDQKKKLYDFCRIEDGTVPVEKVAEELNAIFKAIGEQNKEVKNS